MRLIKTLLVGAALGLSALPAFAKQDIIWWDFLSGGDGVRMKALIDAFNKEHPDIQVKGTTLEWACPSIPRCARPPQWARGLIS